jgi:hypothetical protein
MFVQQRPHAAQPPEEHPPDEQLAQPPEEQPPDEQLEQPLAKGSTDTGF